MQNLHEVSVKKEIIVKKISASQYEVYDGSEFPKEKKEVKTFLENENCNSDLKRLNNDVEKGAVLVPRQTVIKRAPPAAKITTKPNQDPPMKKRKTENSSSGVILIKDAIMYRIIDILMWKVVGENMLKTFGYPIAPTYQVLWKLITHMGAKKMEQYPKDHDCGGNMNCFVNHVYQFLEICAPDLWKKTGWAKLSIEEVLRRIYYEDLIPYLRSIDLRNSVSVLQCHSDIVLLEKWEKQKFTAVTWMGQKYFSQQFYNSPKCPQCSNRHY